MPSSRMRINKIILIGLCLSLLLSVTAHAAIWEELRLNTTQYTTGNPFGPATAGGRSWWQTFQYQGTTGRNPYQIEFNSSGSGMEQCYFELRELTGDGNPGNPGTTPITVIANTSVMSNCTIGNGIAERILGNFTVRTTLKKGFNYSVSLNFTTQLPGHSGGSGKYIYTDGTPASTYAPGRTWCYQPTNFLDGCGEVAGSVDTPFIFWSQDAAAPVNPIAIVNQTFPIAAYRWTISNGEFYWSTANITMNSINVSLYIDNILNQTATANIGGDVLTNFTSKTLKNGSHTYYIQYWNLTNAINSSTITFTVDSLPRLNTSYPQNNTQFNTQSIDFSASVNSTDSGTAILYIDGSNQGTATFGVGTNVITNITASGLGNAQHTWFMSYDVDGVAFNTTTATFFVDNAPPSITTSFTNNSIYLTSSVTGQFNLSDNFLLFSYNITRDQVQIDGISGLNTTFYQVNMSFSPTGLNSGSHNLSVRVADGHTTNTINDYSVDTGLFNDKLSFSSSAGAVTLQPVSGSVFDDFTVQKETDRYTWIYQPDDTKKTDYVFTIDTSDDIYIVNKKDSQYGTWLVFGGHWMDFEIENENPTLNFNRINPREVQVTVSNLKNPAYQQYHSIGDLNIVQMNYTFVVANVTETHAGTVVETQNTLFNLTVNATIANVNSSAVFWYNGTVYPTTKSTTANVDYYATTIAIPFQSQLTQYVSSYWNVTLQSTNTENGQLNLTQYAEQMSLTNCSAPPTNATGLNYTIYTEGTTSTLFGNASGIWTVWGSDPTMNRTFNFTWANQSNFAVCSFTNVSLNTNYQVQYTAPGYNIRNKNVFGTQINHTNQAIPLYLLASSAATNLVVKLIDQIGNVVQGYILELQRFDITTGTYAPVESEVTDFIGNAQLPFSYQASAKYRIFVYNTSGVNVLNTGDICLSCITTPPLVIQLAQGGLNDFMTVPLNSWRLASTLYNVSTNIYLNWTSLAGTTGTICLNVTKTNATSYLTLNGQCSQSNSGSMTYNVTVGEGRITATSYIQGSAFPIQQITMLIAAQQKLYEQIGMDGLVIYMILIIVAACISITNVSALPWALGIAHITAMAMGLIPFTWGLGGIGMLAVLIVIMVRLED